MTMKRNAGLIILGAVWLLTPGCGEGSGPYQTTEETLDQPPATGTVVPGKVWARVERPGILGWSEERLAQARAYSEEIGSAAVVIVQDGVIVDEWGAVATPLNMRSMRKSLLNALYGSALVEGRIALDASLNDLGVNDKLGLTDAERRATVRHLLASSSGVYHPAAYETPGNARQRPERGTHAPGEFFYYNNWDFNLLGTLYERATGERLFEAFHTRLAIPLGMQDFDPRANEYRLEDISEHPAYLFHVSARDLARFGLLYLQRGRWGDRQILPADWVTESLRAHAATGGDTLDYGYLWWVKKSSDEEVAAPHDAYARGAGGQFLLVSPRRRLVVAHVTRTDPLLLLRTRLGWTPDDDEAWRLHDFILEAAPPVAEARAAAAGTD